MPPPPTDSRTPCAPAAPRAARCAAFLLDLLCALALALLCALLGWLWLLLWTRGGRYPPSDATIYTAIAIGLLWLPLAGIATVLGWSGSSRTPGKAALRLRVEADTGGIATPWQALLRLLVLVLFALPLVIGPLLLVFAIAAAAEGTIPAWLGAVIALPFGFGLVDPAIWLLRRDRRALHDLVAGTRVVLDKRT